MRIWKTAASLVTAAMVAVALAGAASAAQSAGSPQGSIERITVHGRALEGNLEGDSPDRPVVVYLPTSYANEPQRRYPVMYSIPGFTGDHRDALRYADEPPRAAEGEAAPALALGMQWGFRVAVLCLAALLIGHALGGPDRGDRTVLALSSAMRHPAMAIALAQANFSHEPLIVPAILLYLIVAVVVRLPYTKLSVRRQAEFVARKEAYR